MRYNLFLLISSIIVSIQGLVILRKKELKEIHLHACHTELMLCFLDTAHPVSFNWIELLVAKTSILWKRGVGGVGLNYMRVLFIKPWTEICYAWNIVRRQIPGWIESGCGGMSQPRNTCLWGGGRQVWIRLNKYFYRTFKICFL